MQYRADLHPAGQSRPAAPAVPATRRAAGDTAPQPTAGASVSSPTATGRGLRFSDLLDLVNPLHHLPLVGTLYRKITGDVIAPALRVAGGAVYGGPLGAAFAAASVAVNAIIQTPHPQAETSPEAATDMLAGRDTNRIERAAFSTQSEATTAPGGWLVAVQRPATAVSGPRMASVAENPSDPGPTPGPDRVPRRGGWMVEAAYAAADRLRPQPAPASVRDAV